MWIYSIKNYKKTNYSDETLKKTGLESQLNIFEIPAFPAFHTEKYTCFPAFPA